MTVGHTEAELRDRLARRAHELGADPRPDAVRMRYTEVPGLPHCTLVAGTWRSGPTRSGVTGLVCRDEEPDLRPGPALVSVLQRWHATQRPPPAAVAGCVAFLLDPLDVRVPLLGDSEVRGWRSTDGAAIATPIVDTEPGSDLVTSVRFWWREDDEVREVVVDVDAEGRVAIGGGRTAVRGPDDDEGERP